MLKKGLEGYSAQTHSKKDSNAAWQLKSDVEKLLNKKPELRKLAEEMISQRYEIPLITCPELRKRAEDRVSRRKEKDLQDQIAFCGVIYPLFNIKLGKETQAKMAGGEIRRVFPLTIYHYYEFSVSCLPALCCLLATSECRAFLRQVEALVGPKSRRKLEAKAVNVGAIFNKLNERARKGQEAWIKEDGITFWLSEYIKRKFVLDLIQPEKLEKAEKAFKFMQDYFKSVVEDVPSYCFDCAWAYSDRCYKTEYPFLYSWIGCDSRDCQFNLKIRAYTEYYTKHREEKCGVPIDDTNRDWWDGLEAAVELSLEYGVYPHELFALPSAGQIFKFRKEHPVLPKRTLLKQFTTKGGRNKRNPFHTFERFFEGKKEAYCGYRYQEKDEFRLIGLWLWDQVQPREEKEELSLSVIESLADERWFHFSELGQIWRDRVEKAEKRGNADDKLLFNEIVREFRDAFALTNESVRNASLLPRERVKRKKK